MTNLIVVGAGSQARYVIENARRGGTLQVVALVDVESGSMIGQRIHDVPVACGLADLPRLHPPGSCRLVVGYGDNRRKRELVQQLTALGYGFQAVVSPAAYVSMGVTLGEGCIVNPGATILPDARIGAHAIVHSGAVIEHDNQIGDYANIGPGVHFGGYVVVEEAAWVFTGASVKPRVRIGREAVVGAGAVVIRDVPPGVTVAGCPARALERGRE